MARLIDKGTREYTCALIMMFFGSLAAFGAEYCLYLFWHKILT